MALVFPYVFLFYSLSINVICYFGIFIGPEILECRREVFPASSKALQPCYEKCEKRFYE